MPNRECRGFSADFLQYAHLLMMCFISLSLVGGVQQSQPVADLIKESLSDESMAAAVYNTYEHQI